MYFGVSEDPRIEKLRDDFSHVGCGLCKYFQVDADRQKYTTCKRLDHKTLQFAVPWFKSYDCGQFGGILCRDFAPATWVKHLHEHWIGTDDYVGTVPSASRMSLVINKNTEVRYEISTKEFYDGTFITKDGKLKCYGKMYYVQRRDKEKFPIGYELVYEKFDPAIEIEIEWRNGD